ncbi:MAG: hypothetical protein ABI464_03375 [Chthoniobacteraceae bacterium]
MTGREACLPPRTPFFNRLLTHPRNPITKDFDARHVTDKTKWEVLVRYRLAKGAFD